MQTTIQKIEAGTGQRIIAMSDVHGHLDYMIQLLRKIHYEKDDILIIDGDLVDKGPQSLQLVRYVMELALQNPVYVSKGNVDEYRVDILCGDDAQRFLDFVRWQKDQWGCGLILDMLSGLGLSADHLTPENASEYQNRLKEHYRAEIDFLKNLPTILDMGSYIFVHGGIPTDDLESLRKTEEHAWLKNDRFYEKGYRFSRCVVVGHYPVCLFVYDKESLAPIFDYERKIICMDGGCGIQQAGQLNALIFPDKDADMKDIEWTFYDGFPTVIAKESQKGEPFSAYVNFNDSLVELLEEKGDMVLCRQVKNGKTIWVPSIFLYQTEDGKQHVDNYCDAVLETKPGDRLSAVYRGSFGCLGKLDGILGWYRGEYEEEPETMELLSGRPKEEKVRRARERAVYDLLDDLGIAYSHVDHREANTMKVCEKIDEVLEATICKNLFLRNQQKTKFYLLMMPGDKKFLTKELSRQIGSARLSFAEPEFMEQFLHISPGAVSVMGLMNDVENRVQLLIDKEVLGGEYLGCHPCVNTSSIRLKMKDLLEAVLPAMHHEPVVVEL